MYKSLLTVLATVSLSVVAATAFAAPAATSSKLSDGVSAASAKGGNTEISVLIDTSSKNYSRIVSMIEKSGGKVGHQFKHINGLSATIPATALAELSAMRGVDKVTLDSMLYPGPQGGYDLATLGTAVLGERTDLDSQVAANKGFNFPADSGIEIVSGGDMDTYYSYFPDSMNTAPLFDGGNLGAGSLVVIIDTGTFADHVLLTGKVIGGVDISTDAGGAFEGATISTNHYHGTHVGGIIAGEGAALLPDTSLMAASVEYYAGITLPAGPPGTKVLPLFGTAPHADLYAIKVFPHTGDGAPTSTIIAGIEIAIDMKVNGGYDVDVINMSLGGGTGFEGRDLESQAVDAATAIGITVVVSAGNDGPASQTVGSPSGANTAITVGNIAHPVNTRVFWDQNYGSFGIGEYLFVDNNPQMLYSSSRGNTSDGREKPTASAVGTFVLSSVTPDPEDPNYDPNSTTDLAFLTGTSMSSPAMAGIVALMNSHSEDNGLDASPYDYKQAAVAGSSPLSGFDAYEQGAGFIDAEGAAMSAFMSDSQYGTAHPSLKKGYSAKARKPYGMKLSGINKVGGQTFAINDLPVGYVQDYYFDLHPNAERIIVDVTDVVYGADPLFQNSFEVHLMSGMRTTDAGYYFYTTNVWGDATLIAESMNSEASGWVYGVNAFPLPLMPGHVRLSIENDWTAFTPISGTFTVTVEHGDQSDKPDESYSGVLNTGEDFGFFPVGFGPNGVELELNWKNDWSVYPTSDMDIIVFWEDSGGVHLEFGGATSNSPEILEIDSSDILWIDVLVDGYETYGVDEPWTLEVMYK